MGTLPSITVTSLDLSRLEGLLSTQMDTTAAEALEDELSRAAVIAPQSVPPTLVTMNSTVRFVFEETGEQRELTLCYPKDAGAPGTVSVLAPIGSALLGLSVGDVIDWPVPGGGTRRVRILELVYQPERAGDYHR
jgi:regulator of nucleoside diphosphate kinase